ncbi:MAG TPA: alpha/beta hydrolase [Stackebrandtia sp.]|jgi:pimeloyl-ACP methyl ester carboxylesterase|uniref:alpha/beta hydrolase n=1 Tax=Stackebrandtia sp. TaxID=2023065 RepID=UPI002D2D8624|nr:alpha/beta hydrolase [Stackebrandtia sp.]HZE39244.1 alpha/beta hydrolase [Stackebrandtia sp.]
MDYGQLKKLDLHALEARGKSLKAMSRSAETHGEQLNGHRAKIPSVWKSADSAVAAKSIRDHVTKLDDIRDSLGKVANSTLSLVSSLRPQQHKTDRVESIVRSIEGAKMDGRSGKITYEWQTDKWGPYDKASPQGKANFKHNQALVKKAGQLVREAVDAAGRADDKASAAVRGLQPQAIALAGFPQSPKADVPEPPKGKSPEENAAWWKNVPEIDKGQYIEKYPGKIGSMNGLPATDRDAANMITLRADAAGGNDTAGAKKLLDRIEASQKGPADKRVYLLGYTPPGKDGSPDAKVIAAIGNPDLANNTAVFVPGTGSNLGNIGGDMDRMINLQNAAEKKDSGSTSTIVWLGYDAPDNIPAAALSEFADSAAPDLRDFSNALAASHQNGKGHTVVIGHSYGATVVGTADALGHQGKPDGLNADDIVVLGSPGMGNESPDRRGFIDGPKVDDISDLHISKEHFWAGAASNDPVSYLEVHGNSPVDVSFNGQRFTTDGASGHSEYWDPDTESLQNQADVLTKHYKDVKFVGRRFG